MKTPSRAAAFSAPARRAPAVRSAVPCAQCGHPRSEHRHGSRDCRHTKTTRTYTEDAHGLTEHTEMLLCDCLRMK